MQTHLFLLSFDNYKQLEIILLLNYRTRLHTDNVECCSLCFESFTIENLVNCIESQKVSKSYTFSEFKGMLLSYHLATFHIPFDLKKNPT